MRRYLVPLVFLLIGLVIGCAIVAAGAEPRKADKMDVAIADGRQVIVQVGADWCGPCHEVRNLYGPWFRSHGVYVNIDWDRDRDICQRWRFSPPFPKIIVYPPRPARPAPPYLRVPRVYVGTEGAQVFVGGGR